MLITAGILTALLVPTVLVMGWRCWLLPPVPAIRVWSLSFAGMTLAMLAWLWMAQYWRTKFERCRELGSPRLQQWQLCPRSWPKIVFYYQDFEILYGDG